MILRCALCHHTGLDVESRIVADETAVGYHRELRCVDREVCEERVAELEGETPVRMIPEVEQ